jgi:hypothetical protein
MKSKGADYERPPVAFCCDLMTRLTTFASSIKNARTMLSVTNTRVSGVNVNKDGENRKAYRERTQPPHLEPPYARLTCFCVFETDAYSRGRRATTYHIGSDVSARSVVAL